MIPEEDLRPGRGGSYVVSSIGIVSYFPMRPWEDASVTGFILVEHVDGRIAAFIHASDPPKGLPCASA